MPIYRIGIRHMLTYHIFQFSCTSYLEVTRSRLTIALYLPSYIDHFPYQGHKLYRRSYLPQNSYPSFLSTATRPPVIYSQPWSPTPSTTAIAPEFRTAEAFACHAVNKCLSAGSSVKRHITDNNIFIVLISYTLRRIDDQLAS